VAGATSAYVPVNIRVINAVKAFRAGHGIDFVGLNRAIASAGGRGDVRPSQAGLSGLLPNQTQAAYDRGGTVSIAL
jgi:hypothetical protein